MESCGHIISSFSPAKNSHHTNTMSDFRIDRLIAAFQVFDDSKTGKIPTVFMVSVLSQFGTPFTKDEVEEFKNDADENGFVDYTKLVQQVIFAPGQ